MLLEWGAEPTGRPIPADQKWKMKNQFKNEKWKMKNQIKNEKWKMEGHIQKWKNQKFKKSLRGKYKDSIMKK